MQTSNPPPRQRRRRSYYAPIGCFLPIPLFLLLIAVLIGVPWQAARAYGPAGENLGPVRQFQYSLVLIGLGDQLTTPLDSTGGERLFVIPLGSSANDVARRLQESGLIRDADAFGAYLSYTGIETRIQSGEFLLSPALSPIQIAQRLQDATPTRVKFAVLPGWRIEEVAGVLPTSGLPVTPDEFLALASNPPNRPDFIPAGVSVEGFLLPGEYTIPRKANASELLTFLVNNFSMSLSADMREGFRSQGLTVYQAVTLASLVQREAVKAEEQTIIASVFLNRLKFSMNLQSDPTIQYALGWDADRQSWWRSPLSASDLQIESPYNTYQVLGLPPGPIASPSLSALQAVAFPAETSYFFFRARCDGSGFHSFAETYDQHLQNGCQ